MKLLVLFIISFLQMYEWAFIVEQPAITQFYTMWKYKKWGLRNTNTVMYNQTYKQELKLFLINMIK